MQHEVSQQSSSPPHDALQRLLRLMLNDYLGAALVALWPLILIAMLVLCFVSLSLSTLATLAPFFYLFHLWMAVTALIFLRVAIVSLVHERSPMRLSPALRRAFTRQPARRPGSGWRAAWTGIWGAIYFGACAVLLPWPPLPYPIRTVSPSVLLLGAAYPIMLIIARGPDWWYWMRERRRRANMPG